MLALLIATLLLIASRAQASKSTNGCCDQSFVRIDINSATPNTQEDRFIETPFSGTVPPDTCTVLDGNEGVPVCRLTVATGLPADPTLLSNNALCPYLSPANVKLQQGTFQCAAYLDPLIPFSCDDGAVPQCRYNNLSDFVPFVPAGFFCSVTAPTVLSCESASADLSLCPSTALFNGNAHPLSAARCFPTSNTALVTPYAAVVSQYRCNNALQRLVFMQQAGCYLQTAGSACPDTTPAQCFYAVPKPDSY